MLQNHLPAHWADFMLPFQTACLSHLPSSPHRHAFAAIVCGAQLPSGEFKENLRTTGLLHIMIVSGSHLVLLEQLLLFASKATFLIRFLVFPGLTLFALASGFQPPVVRALFGVLLRGLNRRWKLGWSPVHTITISGFVSLYFCRTNGDILSLLLSWCASLALAGFSSRMRHDAALRPSLGEVLLRNLQSHFFVYLCLTPLVVSFAPPHPFTILTNWILGPVMGLLLFPLSLLVVLFHPLIPLGNAAWALVSQVLSWVAGKLPAPPAPAEVALVWPWIYIFGLTVFLLALERSELAHALKPTNKAMKRRGRP